MRHLLHRNLSLPENIDGVKKSMVVINVNSPTNARKRKSLNLKTQVKT